MGITDPTAIRFSNEVIRPLCERFRALEAEVASASTDWFGGVSSLFPNDSTTLDDGRHDAEGVSVLTGADITSAMTQFLAFQTQMTGGGVAGVIAKPCVRPLQAS